jgi:hypothetical protein
MASKKKPTLTEQIANEQAKPKADPFQPITLPVGEGISPRVAAELFKIAMRQRGIERTCEMFAQVGISRLGRETKEEAHMLVYGEFVQTAFVAGLEAGYAMGREVFSPRAASCSYCGASGDIAYKGECCTKGM